MGHISPEAAKQMVSSKTIEGIDIDLTSEIQQYDSCEYGTIKTPEQPNSVTKFTQICTWGPSPIQTPGHKSYYVSFTDNYTRWTNLQLLATKDGVFQAYKYFKAWAKLHLEIPAFKVLCSRRGGEYLGTELSKHLYSQGRIQQLTVHDTPEYNGVSEHLNQTLLERIHTLLHSSKLPKNLWREAINHVVWLKNRTITCALPWESQVWVHTMDGTKLDGRLKIGRWIGFDEISNGHQIYWLDKCLVTVKHSIKFVNDKAVFLSNLIAKPIQGENNPINIKNLQHNPETRLLEAENYQDDPGDLVTDNAINFVTDNATDFVTDKQNQQQKNPLNKTANKPETPQNPEIL
jgi:hypothetical protein